MATILLFTISSGFAFILHSAVGVLFSVNNLLYSELSQEKTTSIA